MTPSETLTKAIDKAIANGYSFPKLGDGSTIFPDPRYIYHMSSGGIVYGGQSVFWLIYSHDFAKALWPYDDHYITAGTEGWCSTCRMDNGDRNRVRYCWQFHLQRMIIADDPISYLAEHM